MRVTFEDDAGNPETRTSAATVVVKAADASSPRDGGSDPGPDPEPEPEPEEGGERPH